MSVLQPVYVIQLISGSTTRYTFSSGGTSKITSLSLKPGLTTTIGSFELTVPDITGSLLPGGAYVSVLPFEDVKIWVNYSNTGSTPNFAGKIETISAGLDVGQGYWRRFVGSDYGECLTRVLANRAFPNNSGDNIIQGLRNHCTGSTTGNLSTDNGSMAGDSNTYTNLVLSNSEVFRGIQDIASQSNKDFYIDTSKILHYFEKQSSTGSETFSVGGNIKEYSIHKDVNVVKNDIYVFGMRDPSSVSGSDIPLNHDLWTELTTGSLRGWVSGSDGTNKEVVVGILSGSLGWNAATGSNAIDIEFTGSTGGGITYDFSLTKTLPTNMYFIEGDVLHFWMGVGISTDWVNPYARLYDTTNSNYFQCNLESESNRYNVPGTEITWTEYSVSLGPSLEGTSATGSQDSNTGSYKWSRTGTPDWFNVQYLLFGFTTELAGTLSLAVDGVYFGTRFSSHKSGSSSIETYGLRKYIDTNDNYNSDEYCANVASVYTGSLLEPITQVEITTTGSPGLVLGSKYSVVLPAENINTYLQLIDLEHIIDSEGFITKELFTDKKEIRTIIPIINYPVQEVQKYISLWDAIKGGLVRERLPIWMKF